MHVLNIHTIEKKKINSGFQRSGNELTDYVKRNIFSFSRVISEKRKKKYRDKTTMNELIREGWGGGGGSNFPYILLNEIQTMFSQLAKQSSRQYPAVL